MWGRSAATRAAGPASRPANPAPRIPATGGGSAGHARQGSAERGAERDGGPGERLRDGARLLRLFGDGLELRRIQAGNDGGGAELDLRDRKTRSVLVEV